MKKNDKLFVTLLVLTMVLFSACTKNQEENFDLNDSNLGNVNFENYLEEIRVKYKNSDKIIALEFEYIDDVNVQIKDFSELSGIEATLALATSNINLVEDSLALSKCSSRDKSRNNCYTLTCHTGSGSSSSQCTGGAFGSCLSAGKACLDKGGCVEVCRLPPRLLYIPLMLDEDSKEIVISEQFHLFAGED